MTGLSSLAGYVLHRLEITVTISRLPQYFVKAFDEARPVVGYI